MLYRALAAGSVVAAASMGLGPALASATPAPVDLTMVGSNATQEVMGALATTYNNSSPAKTANVHVTNVFAQPVDPGTVAKSDLHCNGGKSITYIQEPATKADQETAPNGSGAGRTALATSVTNGDSCTSIARSSSPGSSSDPAGTQAFAYAVDSVTWSTSKSGHAPTNLLITQLEGVYDCKYTNWSQVGGTSGPIVRYYPVEGSGIATFFAGVLGFDPRVLGGVNTCTTAPTLIEQNEDSAIPTSKRSDAVTIWSGGAWITQGNGIDPDLREGFVVHGINGKGSPVMKTNTGTFAVASIVNEANVEPSTYLPTSTTKVQGINNVFNFINTESVDYKAAYAFVGPKSLLCTGADGTAITKYGLQPLNQCIQQA
jgi:ABC-type phosphate transport system substrate-binding protein